MANPIREVLIKGEDVVELKILKDYALVREELYRKMPGGVLSRCMGQEEAQRKLKEVHDKTCGSYGVVNLYRRLQRAGFYWPSMGKDVDQVQTQCGTCQLAADREESYAMFVSEDWRNPFIQYLTEGILPQKHNERYKFKRLATRYFLHNMVLFKKGYDGDPLSKRNDKRSTFWRMRGTPGEEKTLQMPAADGLLLACHEKRYDIICEKMPQLSSTS